jgi:hypothetical protein
MTDIELLLELAAEAIDYTPEYFRNKWGLDVRLLDLRRRLTTASTVTAAPVGLWDNENDDDAAAGEPDR